jgi:transposase
MVAGSEDVRMCSAGFLPLISAYAARIGLVEEIDRLVKGQMEVSPGRVVLALILDALTGRSPLFRVAQFFADKDVELLLGQDFPVSKLNDDTLGRVMDRIAEVGTNTILGAVAMSVVRLYSLDLSHVHHDVTSQSVYGDYILREEDGPPPFLITQGFSKNHRPDLKQLVHSLLCVDHGIPISSKLLDGNQSDKTINRNLIPEMVKRMRTLGQKTFVYVADSALVTKENLGLIDDWENGFLFVSRLPMTYGECRATIEEAVEADTWEEIGMISQQPVTPNRKPASYRAFEAVVTLYGIVYRALVVHSDAHDRRRQKKVDKAIAKEQEEIATLKKSVEKIEYACLPDAEAAMARIPRQTYHELTVTLEPQPHYYPGRPKADAPRRIKRMGYRLKISATLAQDAVERLRKEAGCFVLISNTLSEGTDAVRARDLLTIYKDQHMVERNFAFLKDPVFVNALFLKSPSRIEALGLILVLALLICRLMERTMRRNLCDTQSTVTGWENRQTSRPTSFMLTTKFVGVFILVSALGRRLGNPMNPVQLRYLEILELTPEIFLNPFAARYYPKKRE